MSAAARAEMNVWRREWNPRSFCLRRVPEVILPADTPASLMIAANYRESPWAPPVSDPASGGVRKAST